MTRNAGAHRSPSGLSVCVARTHRPEKFAGAEVVPRVQPEEALEDRRRAVEVTGAPAAQAVPVQRAEVGAVVNETPREHPVEVLAELVLPETHADLVVGVRDHRMVREDQVAEVDVGVDAADVGLTSFMRCNQAPASSPLTPRSTATRIGS